MTASGASRSSDHTSQHDSKLETDASLESTSSPIDPGIVTRELPFLRLLILHAGAAMTLFLATTDATIVSTALPTIAAQLGADHAEYTWVSVAYLLTQTVLQPLYGRLSTLLGRRTLLFISIFIFAAGSALCGAAQSITWLILARALAGTGGGGIVAQVWSTTRALVEPTNYPKWSTALSITWAASAVGGPLLGGVFSGMSGTFNWRWGFYINLPICAIASIILGLSLRNVTERDFPGDTKPPRPEDRSWRKVVARFDIIGLLLFMAGSSSVIIGFSFATQLGWGSPTTITLIVVGIAVLVLGMLNEAFLANRSEAIPHLGAMNGFLTQRDPIFPIFTFTDRTLVITQVTNFLHQIAFNTGTFYLALYFQAVIGLSPFRAGIEMLPYTLGSAAVSIPVNFWIGRVQKITNDTTYHRRIISAGLLISAIGFGLMIILSEHTPRALQIVFPLISGVGIGMVFSAPFQVFGEGINKNKKMLNVDTDGTGAFLLVRFTGATVGLALAGAVFLGSISRKLPSDIDARRLVENLDVLRARSDFPQMQHTMAHAIKIVWAVCVPCLVVPLIITVFTRKIPIEKGIDQHQFTETSMQSDISEVQSTSNKE